jgi:hypothetical protein
MKENPRSRCVLEKIEKGKEKLLGIKSGYQKASLVVQRASPGERRR